MKKRMLFPLFASLLPTLAFAQGHGTPPPPAVRLYDTQSRLRLLQTTSSEVTDAMSAIERFTADFQQNGHVDTVNIALVFHLMPLPGGASGPSEVDIQAQMDRLAIDFFVLDHPYLAESYQHPVTITDAEGNITGTEVDQQSYRHEADKQEHFAEHAGRPLIRFCLAAMDPNGQSTTGVIQVSGLDHVWEFGESPSGGSAPWTVARYCNIWVARLANDIAGYAQLPGGPAGTDGVVIDDRFFARAQADSTNPYYLGRTLTHLLGSYLNLYELWNELTPCGDDYVDDTPIHNASNYGLSNYRYQHFSTCDGNPVEMLCNLMDNTGDSSQYLFTQGQVMRMQAALAEGGPRYALRFTPTTCTSTIFNAGNPADRTPAGGTTRQVVTSELDLLVFPNPASGRFTVQIRSDRETRALLRVYNMTGSLVYEKPEIISAGTSRQEMEAGQWPAGWYTVVLRSDAGNGARQVFVERP